MTVVIPNPPRQYRFPQNLPFDISSEVYYNPLTDAWCYVGSAGASQVNLTPARGKTVAIDIETKGTRKFLVRCITAAWDVGDRTINIFLDVRDPRQMAAAQQLMEDAATLVLHNATYDIPPLYQTGVMTLDQISTKVFDTLVLARMFDTINHGGRTLDELVHRFVPGFPDSRYKIQQAMAVAGHRAAVDKVTGEKHSAADVGYQDTIAVDPVWRSGAMSDTVATLRLLNPLYEAVITQQREFAHIAPHEWHEEGDQWTHRLIMREQITNRVMLRRSAVGIAANYEYAEDYKKSSEQKIHELSLPLHKAGIDPEAGNIDALVVQYLYDRGELPSDWPTTKTGKLKSDKKTTAALADNPLISNAVQIKESRKIVVYLEKILEMARTTGRIHPEVGVLGASTTGRMSYRNPELQQFPKDARPIMCADPGRGMTSIDWSSIEPVILANAARDYEYLSEFDVGGDLYIPSAKIAGLIPQELSFEDSMAHPGRKKAKTIVLANMYGQGKALLAKNLKVSEDEAVSIKNQYNQAMQPTVAFLENAKRFANANGFIRTLDGRGLLVPESTQSWGNDKYAGYKAQNFIVQGSAYSMLSETINKIYEAGLADAIHMAIHDELVVDSEATHDIQKIMEISPEWLNNKAGRKAIIRTDSNDMGDHWQYV